jgi:2'-5' RNA ligase
MKDIGTDKMEEIEQRLDEVRATAFELRISGVDWFGGRRPHSVFARVEPDPRLLRLRESVERACQKAGMEPDGRRFVPHVTLARCRGADLREVRRFVSAHGLFSAGPFPVERFTLFSARP